MGGKFHRPGGDSAQPRGKLTFDLTFDLTFEALRTMQKRFFLVCVTPGSFLQLVTLKKSANLKAINMITWLFTPSLIALVSFTTFVLSDPANVLTPTTTFVSLALFGILRLPLALLPAAITGLVMVKGHFLSTTRTHRSVDFVFYAFVLQSKLSLNRISQFLQGEEIDMKTVTRVAWDDKNVLPAISVQHGTFSWSKDDELPVLRDINLDILPGQLVAVVGPVGSGTKVIFYAIICFAINSV